MAVYTVFRFSHGFDRCAESANRRPGIRRFRNRSRTLFRVPAAADDRRCGETLAGEEGRHLAIEAPTGVGKTLSYLIPGIAIAREEQKTLVVSTANVALQDQIYSKDLPLLRKIIPDLRFTAAFGRGRYVCPRNLTALASTEPSQQDLLAFLDDDLTPNNQAEQKLCDPEAGSRQLPLGRPARPYRQSHRRWAMEPAEHR